MSRSNIQMEGVFYVIKFDRPPKKCLAKYLCVPESWTTPHEGERLQRHVQRRRVWYPSFETPKTINYLVKRQERPDLNNWGMFIASVHFTGKYANALGFIAFAEFLKAGIHRQPSFNQPQPTPEVEILPVKSEPICIEDSEVIEVDSEVNDNNSLFPIDCLLARVQQLLNDIKKETQESFRFEFDEIRCVRESDNVIVGREPKLTINLNVVVDEPETADTIHIKQEVTSTSDGRSSARGQYTLPPQPSVTVSRESPSRQNFNNNAPSSSGLNAHHPQTELAHIIPHILANYGVKLPPPFDSQETSVSLVSTPSGSRAPTQRRDVPAQTSTQRNTHSGMGGFRKSTLARAHSTHERPANQQRLGLTAAGISSGGLYSGNATRRQSDQRDQCGPAHKKLRP